MGQCYVRLKAAVKRRLRERGGERQYRHERYDYTPKRFWKYKDDQVLNQISLRGTEYDSPVWELEERGEVGRGDDVRGESGERVLLNPMIDEDSEEEDVGEVRRGGRLVFAEVEEQEEEDSQTPLTPPGEDIPRQRSSSSSSQKIGRFEVSEVPAGSGDIRDGEGEREGEREGEVGELQIEAEVSETDTTQLLGNNHNLT